jgi:DedD protein
MSAENGIPENEDVKKKALLRLAVAGIVTSAALAGLWWLDQSGSEEKITEPAPIVAAPPPEVAAPATTETVTPAAEPEVTPAEPPQVASHPSEGDFPDESPPPPKVSNNPTSQVRKPPPPNAPPEAKPEAARQNIAQPVAKPAVEPQQTASGKGFVVQLGVFSNPDNARELVEKLKKQGVRAHLEARVQLGPFLNRQEAEKAQLEMRRLGYNALVTLPYSAAATK